MFQNNPQFPLYIPSKGRFKKRLTIKALENMKVPYHVIVEEQEYKDYGLLPDNAVDNTAVGAITMQANSGGLANLFRVKNQ